MIPSLDIPARRRAPRLPAIVLAAVIVVLCSSGASALAAAAPTVFAPVASTTYAGTVPVHYTLGAAPQSGTTLTFTSLSNTYVLTLGGVALNGNFSFNTADPVGTSGGAILSMTGGGSSIVDGSYTVTLTYTSSMDHTTGSSTVMNVGIDTVTQTPTLSSPTSSTLSGPLPVAFTLPEAASPGSVMLTFASVPSGSFYALTVNHSAAGSDSFSVNPASPLSGQVTAISPGTRIPDGTYDVTLRYQDAVGNAAASSATSRVTLDNVTQTPLLSAPASAASVTGPIAVDFTLPEAALPGSTTLTFSGAQSYVVGLGDTSAGEHTLTLDPSAPRSSADVVSLSGGSSIPPGTYTVTLSYQDAFGNPIQSASSTAVTLAAAVLAPSPTPPISTPAPPVVSSAPLLGALTGPSRVTREVVSLRRVRAACERLASTASRGRCLNRRAPAAPRFTLTVGGAATIVLRYTTKAACHARRCSATRTELALTRAVTAPGTVSLSLTRRQWARLRAGRTTLTASVGGSSVAFVFVVR